MAQDVNSLDSLSFQTFAGRSVFHVSPHDSITIPHDVATGLPIFCCFAPGQALKTAQRLIMGCVTNELSQNLTHLQKVLLRLHFRLGHIGFQWLQ